MTVQYSPDQPAAAILRFWFDEVGKDRWFARSDLLDAEIGRRFNALRLGVLASKAKAWRDGPDPLLAAIILLDQFSRNLHRGSAAAFAGDPLALELTNLALGRDWDRSMSAAQRQFLLMPLMHSERIADQQRAVVEYRRLGDEAVLAFAQAHHDQIERFGRFPGRNAALGRRSTSAEQAALDAGAAF